MTFVASQQSSLDPSLTSTVQEYELAEEEVSISLDRFRDEYCNPDGSVKYVARRLLPCSLYPFPPPFASLMLHDECEKRVCARGEETTEQE